VKELFSLEQEKQRVIIKEHEGVRPTEYMDITRESSIKVYGAAIFFYNIL
jgi:hypothetical protein